MTFKGKLRLSDVWVKKNCYIELIAVYIHPKNSNHLRSHLRTIMALDHSRLGLENKSGWIFCLRQVYLTKSCQQIWVRVNQHFILFIHHIWDETVIWGAVFIIRTTDKMQCFTISQDKLYSFNLFFFQNRTKQAWAFSKKFPKSSIRPAGSHFWQAPNFQWTLKESLNLSLP